MIFFFFSVCYCIEHCICSNVSFNNSTLEANKSIRKKKKSTIIVFSQILHHMTRPGSILRGVQIYLCQSFPARVRIWVISTVTAPNKHISCKSCSSRTRPSVAATMIAFFLKIIELCLLKLSGNALFLIIY